MKRPLLLLTLCLLGFLAVTILVPGIKRCRAIEKFLDTPGARQRANIVPRFVRFDVPPPANPIDIGYATFDLGPAVPAAARTAAGTKPHRSSSMPARSSS